MTETAIMRATMLAVGSLPDTRIFRNNCGLAVHADGSRVVYGLCPGSSDLIGWQSLIVTPDMVGERIARFVALEVKTSIGRTSLKQQQFLDVLTRAGGLGAVVRSPAEAAAMFAEVGK